MQTQVSRLVDDAHAAPSQLAQDLVTSHRRQFGQGRHCDRLVTRPATNHRRRALRDGRRDRRTESMPELLLGLV